MHIELIIKKGDILALVKADTLIKTYKKFKLNLMRRNAVRCCVVLPIVSLEKHVNS